MGTGGSADGEFDEANLRPDRLLIAPIYINRLGWSRGYFETVGNRPLVPEDLLTQHCSCVTTGTISTSRGGPYPPRWSRAGSGG